MDIDHKELTPPGVVSKTAFLKSAKVTESDLEKINQYTLEPLTADDVYIIKCVIADNEQDDRNFMPFNAKAIKDMSKLYPGVTMLKDHNCRADSQVARIFDAQVITDSSRKTELGENHTELIVKAYMLKTSSNADFIAEIKAGIKKEVSTSCLPEKLMCSVCGKDNMKGYCPHFPGKTYGDMLCTILIDGAKEAYELSFVAVPAQPRAGTRKSTFVKPFEKETEQSEEKNPEVEKEAKIMKRILSNYEKF